MFVTTSRLCVVAGPLQSGSLVVPGVAGGRWWRLMASAISCCTAAASSTVRAARAFSTIVLLVAVTTSLRMRSYALGRSGDSGSDLLGFNQAPLSCTSDVARRVCRDLILGPVDHDSDLVEDLLPVAPPEPTAATISLKPRSSAGACSFRYPAQRSGCRVQLSTETPVVARRTFHPPGCSDEAVLVAFGQPS